MKRGTCIAIGTMICLLSVSSFGLTIHKITVGQLSGATAQYNAQAGTVTWSTGASGVVINDAFDLAFFDQVSVSATFSGMTDLSAAGVAKASFSTGTWSMDLGVTGNPGIIHLAGNLKYDYVEEEVDSDAQSQKIDGSAVVNVTESYFDFDFLGNIWGGLPDLQVQWGNANGLGSLLSNVLFTPGYRDITDYQQDYLSENTTITLLADDTVAIPEPATMLLLGLGSLLACRRR